MFAFWPLLIAFVISLSGHLIADQMDKFKIRPISVWIISILAGLYLFAGGLNMALGWEDPIGNTDTSKYVHRPRDWVVVQLLRVWPFFLMGVGAIATYIGVMSLRHRKTS